MCLFGCGRRCFLSAQIPTLKISQSGTRICHSCKCPECPKMPPKSVSVVSVHFLAAAVNFRQSAGQIIKNARFRAESVKKCQLCQCVSIWALTPLALYLSGMDQECQCCQYFLSGFRSGVSVGRNHKGAKFSIIYLYIRYYWLVFLDSPEKH